MERMKVFVMTFLLPLERKRENRRLANTTKTMHFQVDFQIHTF